MALHFARARVGGERAAAANAAPPAAAGGLAALPAGRGGGGARWAVAGLRAARLDSAGGERALPETVLQRCSLPSVPLSVCLSLCLPGWISYLQSGGLFFLLILRCLAYPRAGIDGSLV